MNSFISLVWDNETISKAQEMFARLASIGRANAVFMASRRWDSLMDPANTLPDGWPFTSKVVADFWLANGLVSSVNTAGGYMVVLNLKGYKALAEIMPQSNIVTNKRNFFETIEEVTNMFGEAVSISFQDIGIEVRQILEGKEANKIFVDALNKMYESGFRYKGLGDAKPNLLGWHNSYRLWL